MLEDWDVLPAWACWCVDLLCRHFIRYRYDTRHGFLEQVTFSSISRASLPSSIAIQLSGLDKSLNRCKWHNFKWHNAPDEQILNSGTNMFVLCLQLLSCMLSDCILACLSLLV